MIGATKTITIWNKWRNPSAKRDEWVRHVVNNCTWDQEIVSDVSGTGAVVASTYSVLVRENVNYLPNREWNELTDKTARFTLAPGDLVALGEVPREITGAAPDTEAQVKTDLAPNAFTIKAAINRADRYKQGRHYEISGV